MINSRCGSKNVFNKLKRSLLDRLLCCLFLEVAVAADILVAHYRGSLAVES